MARKMSKKELRERGLCTVCGKVNPIPEKSLCPKCRERSSQQRKENRIYYAKIGLCTVCGKNKAEPNKKMCYECLSKEQDRYYEHKNRYRKKESDKERKQILAENRRENGMCYRCGKRSAVNGGMCGRCKAYLRRYRDDNRHDIMRQERPNYGICYICGKNEVMDGKKVCTDCYATRLKTIPAMLANPNNEYFKQLNYVRVMQVRAKYKNKKHQEREPDNDG